MVERAVKHYPHTMTWSIEGTPSTEDVATGFPVPGANGGEKTALSRYENFKGGSTKTWTNKANETVIQKGIIYVKRRQEIPKKFDTVKLVDPDGDVVFEGEILNVYKGQLNTTIAV